MSDRKWRENLEANAEADRRARIGIHPDTRVLWEILTVLKGMSEKLEQLLKAEKAES